MAARDLQCRDLSAGDRDEKRPMTTIRPHPFSAQGSRCWGSWHTRDSEVQGARPVSARSVPRVHRKWRLAVFGGNGHDIHLGRCVHGVALRTVTHIVNIDDCSVGYYRSEHCPRSFQCGLPYPPERIYVSGAAGSHPFPQKQALLKDVNTGDGVGYIRELLLPILKSAEQGPGFQCRLLNVDSWTPPTRWGEEVSSRFIGNLFGTSTLVWSHRELAAFFKEMMILLIIIGMNLTRSKSISRRLWQCEQEGSHTEFPLPTGNNGG